MPEYAIRFGVSNGAGSRAETWKCWTRVGQGKRDVYLSCRALRGTMKLSLHESGSWHMGYDPNAFQTLFREGDQPESRFASRWKRPPQLEGGLLLAVRIQVPFEAVNIPAPELEPKVVWIEAPEEGNMAEVALFLSDERIPYTNADWPGRQMQASFVGGFPLDGGGGLWIVCRHVPCTYPTHAPLHRRRFARNVDPEKVIEELESLRSLVWGDCEDGSVGLFESPAPLETINLVGYRE